MQVVLIDPPGSSLFNKVKRGVLYTRHEAEGKRLKNPFDTITEGIGINRITANFSKAQVWVLHIYSLAAVQTLCWAALSYLRIHGHSARSSDKETLCSSLGQLFACDQLMAC